MVLTQRKAAAKKYFDKDLHTSMDRSFYEKPKENVTKRLRRELSKKSDDEKMVKLQTKPLVSGIHESCGK